MARAPLAHRGRPERGRTVGAGRRRPALRARFGLSTCLVVLCVALCLSGWLACSAGDTSPPYQSPCRDLKEGLACTSLGANLVVTCHDGFEISRQTCPAGQLCRGGQCLSTGCLAAERLRDGSGCSFYAAHADGVLADRQRPTVFVVASSVSGGAAQVSLQVSTADGWREIDGDLVGPGASRSFVVDVPAAHGAGVISHAGVRLVSDEPVTVMQLQEDDSDKMVRTARGTTLLPTHMLGRQYRAAAFAQGTDSRVRRIDGETGGAALLVLVATEGGTMVNVRLSPDGPAMTSASGKALDAGSSFDFFLEEGEIYQLISARPGADLSATAVTADKPVAAFSGNFATDYGSQNADSLLAFGDSAYEALLPVEHWGSSWLVGWLAPLSFCDSLLGAKPGAGYQLLVLTGPQPATISIRDASPLGQPRRKFELPANASEVVSLTLSDDEPPLELMEVSSNGDVPIWVGQALDCAPGLVAGLRLPLVLGSYVLGFPSGFQHRVAVVQSSGGSFFVDGHPFTTPPASGPVDLGYGVTFLDQADLGACESAGAPGCTHVITGASFGVSWRGADKTTSYGTSSLGLPCEGGVDSCGL